MGWLNCWDYLKMKHCIVFENILKKGWSVLVNTGWFYFISPPFSLLPPFGCQEGLHGMLCCLNLIYLIVFLHIKQETLLLVCVETLFFWQVNGVPALSPIQEEPQPGLWSGSRQSSPTWKWLWSQSCGLILIMFSRLKCDFCPQAFGLKMELYIDLWVMFPLIGSDFFFFFLTSLLPLTGEKCHKLHLKGVNIFCLLFFL